MLIRISNGSKCNTIKTIIKSYNNGFLKYDNGLLASLLKNVIINEIMEELMRACQIKISNRIIFLNKYKRILLLYVAAPKRIVVFKIRVL